jgi:predicted metalloprotease with PDZ domain
MLRSARSASRLVVHTLLVLGGVCSYGAAQNTAARISLVASPNALVKVTLDLPSQTTSLSFLNSYAGVLGLAERIHDVQAFTANGDRVTVQKQGPGEFKLDADATRFSYEVDLRQTPPPNQMSHVSWLNQSQGLLMMSDLLPSITANSNAFSNASIDLQVPAGWTIASGATSSNGVEFISSEADKTLFLIGPKVKKATDAASGTEFSVVTSDDWPVKADEVRKLVKKILEHYSALIGSRLKQPPILMLVPYSGNAGPHKWTAETRGNAVVVLMGRNGSRKGVLDMLSVVLSHELFHLWVPNSLKLEGNYDWFFEGFTMYEALVTDLRLGFISFPEFLDTLGRVYDSYSRSALSDTLSLLDASERRFTTMPFQIYEKGMLVAFLYDLMLRDASRCTSSLDNIYRELFATSTTGQRNGNETIIALLNSRNGMKPFVDAYIEDTTRIDFGTALAPFGFQLDVGVAGVPSQLSLVRNPTKGQRNTLRCLGSGNNVL